MPKPSLLIISFSNIKSDARVLKQVRALSEFWTVTTCSYGEAVQGATNHFSLDSDLQGWAYDRASLILHRYENAYRSNPAVNAAWQMLKGQTFDAIFADEMNTVPLAIRLKPRLGVHADLHEYEPLLKDNLIRWRLFLRPFYEWMAKKYLTQCVSATAAWQKIADEYLKLAGVKVDLSVNYAPYHDLSPTPVGTPIRLVHAGVCQRERGIHNLVSAVQNSTADVILDLYLMPSDPAYLKRIKSQIGDDQRVSLREPAPYAELINVLNGYDVGIHMLEPISFNTRWLLPNKIFDYIQARLGMIVTPSPEMSRIVSQVGNGEVCRDFTPEALTDILDRLTPEQVTAWKLAANGGAEIYRAESQIAVWVDALEKIKQS